MSVHTPSTTAQVQAADIAAAQSTLAATVTAAQATLKSALSAAWTNYGPNDGGKFNAAVAAAYAAYSASVQPAQLACDAACALSQSQQKAVLHLP